MTGVMSRTVVTIGALFLIAAGLIPKIGALITNNANRSVWRWCDCDVWDGGLLLVCPSIRCDMEQT